MQKGRFFRLYTVNRKPVFRPSSLFPQDSSRPQAKYPDSVPDQMTSAWDSQQTCSDQSGVGELHYSHTLRRDTGLFFDIADNMAFGGSAVVLSQGDSGKWSPSDVYNGIIISSSMP